MFKVGMILITSGLVGVMLILFGLIIADIRETYKRGQLFNDPGLLVFWGIMFVLLIGVALILVSLIITKI